VRCAIEVQSGLALNDAAIPGPPNNAPVMHGDCRIDQVAAQGPEPGEDAIFVRARKPGIADDVSY
jgi:hypothetical protein